MSQFFTKVISLIMSVLFALFPNAFVGARQQYENNFDKWAPIIIEAIRTEDVELLESAMCLNIKQNTDELPQKIQKFYDLIEGEIVEVYNNESGSGWSSSDGVSKTQHGFCIYVITDKEEYHVLGAWQTVNTENPEETKIIDLFLTTKNSSGKCLFELKSTEI